jgi:hypothetical protein
VARTSGAGVVGSLHDDLDDGIRPVVELGAQRPRHHRVLQIQGRDVGEFEDLLVRQHRPQGVE